MGQQQGQGKSGSTLRSCLSSIPSSPHGRQAGIWKRGMRIIRLHGTTNPRTRAGGVLTSGRARQQGTCCVASLVNTPPVSDCPAAAVSPWSLKVYQTFSPFSSSSLWPSLFPLPSKILFIPACKCSLYIDLYFFI